ncbi:polysaccharide deacetylase family protein [Candidatus Woesearchaeota archaeon]|jgi:peptidoglycan/xylan/chitin deacetylase (PgdA/CDA1 family)/Tfp pilus assembly protein PilF|nr:polysaccharide deacetylase family protein [Candidatus Woesearchaeota archaeon]MBT5343014.1 polysaccharide deacetylase family protein [Candidatus Woesearchaeota archaeon]
MKYTEIPILMYHEISDKDNDWCVSLQQFEKQLQFLKDNSYKTISLTELKNGINEDKETDEKLIVLTFDDARKGVYDFAFPLLKKFNFTATISVVPDWIDGKNIPEEEFYSLFMSWNELKELSDSGFEIASHSLSHQNLTKLSEEELVKELSESKRIIEEKLGDEVKHFCYPYGQYNETIFKEIKKEYQTAISVRKGFSKKDYQYSRQWVLNNTSFEEFQKLLIVPTISLSMIVRNNENFLGDCLNSVKDLVDEIIILDTGSTDKTKEIASAFTDKIYDFTWVDDFSAARNESLKYATNDWILVLDADEVLDVEDHEQIKEAINDYSISGYRIITRNYSNNSSVSGWIPSSNNFSKNFTGWFPSIKVRLFQNGKNITFTGEIHEMVDSNIDGEIKTLNVPVHHYGASNSTDKTKKYLELTKKKIVSNPDNAKAYFELGVQQKQLGDFSLAEQSFKKSLELDSEQIIPLLNLAIVQQKQDKLDLAVDNYNQVLQKKENADAYFGLGFCYFKKNELENSAKNFSLAIENNRFLLDAYINLGAIYERQEKLVEAEKVLVDVLNISSNNARAHNNLGVVYEKAMAINKAIKCYQDAIKLNHPRKEELKVRVEKMKQFLENQ